MPPPNLVVLNPKFSDQAKEILKDLVAQAERNEIKEVTVVYRTTDDPDGVRWVWSGSNDLEDLIGKLEIIQLRMAKRMFDAATSLPPKK